jgi:nucleoside-diphosphate-sugar epimerase
MRGADGVFHLAARYRVRPRALIHRVNVAGTRNVLEAMREAGVSKGVYTSTLAVFSDTRGLVVNEGHVYRGPWLTEYERTKWIAHFAVAQPMIGAGLPLVVVLPGLVYGPGCSTPLRDMLIQYLRGRLPATPRLTAMCWTHVEDVAEGHILAMERGRPGECYILAGPRHTLIAAFELAATITGIPAPRFHPSPRIMKAAAWLAQLIEPVLPLPDQYTSQNLRLAAGATFLASSDKARSELGWRARPLAEGLRETLAHELRLLGLPS